MSTILMYHYIGDPVPGEPHAGLSVPLEEFRAQLLALRRMDRRTITGSEYGEGLRDGSLGNTVWLTFDDGHIDNYELAFPLLAERGMRASFFVIVEKSLGGEKGFIPIQALREMAETGMEIGSHTLTHPRLAKISPAQARKEIFDSRKRLEDALGREVVSFCAPYGNWNRSIIEMTREAGYRLMLSTIRDNRNTESDRWKLKRAMIQPGRTGWRFRYVFSPLYHWVHERKNRRRWTE